MTVQSQKWPCRTWDIPGFGQLQSLDDLPQKFLNHYLMAFTQAYRDFSLVREACPALKHNPYFDFDWFLRILGRIKVNCLGFSLVPNDPDLNLGGGGSALVILGSMLNHSCQPNVIVKEKKERGKDLAFRYYALKRVKAGEQLVLSYTNGSSDERARTLLSYGFRCRCPMCKKNPVSAETLKLLTQHGLYEE